jgi:16S rRNA (guanine527-N7)-methyltransferase
MLGLKGIQPIHGRLQDEEILESMGGQFDIAISRAFSDLRTLLILSFPFLKTGGKVLAMKGDVSSEEIPHLHAIEGTPYCLQKTVPFVLPFSDFKRTILLFKKG